MDEKWTKFESRQKVDVNQIEKSLKCGQKMD